MVGNESQSWPAPGTAMSPNPDVPAPPESRAHVWLRRSAWIGAVIAGLASYLLVLQALVTTQNINFFPSLILVGSITVPVAVLVYAWGSGRTVTVSTGLLTLTAIAGGIIGTVAAGTLEYDTLKTLGGVPVLVVGLVEESAKLLVPLAILLVTRPKDPRPGAIIGVASGMGFATLETMGYGFQALLASKGNIADVDQTLLLRALLAPVGHVAWTGLTTAALWRIPSATSKRRAIRTTLLSFALAVLLHAAWDGTTLLLMHVLVAAVSMALLITLIHRAHRA